MGSAFQVAILFSTDHLISPLLLPCPFLFLFQLFSPQSLLFSGPGFLSLNTIDIWGHIILGDEGPSCALFSSVLGPFYYTSGAPSPRSPFTIYYESQIHLQAVSKFPWEFLIEDHHSSSFTFHLKLSFVKQ